MKIVPWHIFLHRKPRIYSANIEPYWWSQETVEKAWIHSSCLSSAALRVIHPAGKKENTKENEKKKERKKKLPWPFKHVGFIYLQGFSKLNQLQSDMHEGIDHL